MGITKGFARKIIWSIFGALLLLLSVVGTALFISVREGISITTPTHQGVIFSRYSLSSQIIKSEYTADSTWTPAPADIIQAERAIVQFWNQPQTLADYPRATKEIAPHMDHYQCQYIGLVIGGRKKIYCNFFLKSTSTEWKRLLEQVEDGGTSFWRILYDLESKTCEHLSVNSDA